MLQFVFWDVQHGSASYIKTPNGRHMVIDLGTGSYSENKEFSPLMHLKKKYGVGQLDYVVITHPHRDHIDDIFNLPKLDPLVLRKPVLTDAEIIAGNKREDNVTINEYIAVTKQFTERVEPGSEFDPTTPERWGNVKMSFHRSYGCSTKNLNNQSIVTVFEYANSKIMIPGDNEAESWNELIKDSRFLSAAKGLDVLIAPHHGRQAGYSPELFEAIGKPYITVISDGPYQDTSATSSYGNQSKGWRVYYPDDSYEERYCVTTRQSGVVRVKAYFAQDGTRRLNVFVQKGSAKG